MRLDEERNIHLYHDLMRTAFEDHPGKYDKERSARVLEIVYSDARGYIEYQMKDKKLVSLLMATSSPRTFQQRYQMLIVAWISNNGQGMKMMRKFLEWIETSRNLRWVSFMTEMDTQMRSYNIVSKRYPLKTTRWSQ